MDVTQALRDAENSLRDFIGAIGNWIDKCGVTPERIEQWKDRKATEEKRQKAGAVEERILYYAGFFDLKPILKKHWNGIFSDAFGEWKTMEVFLTELEKLRDPDAHRRELLPHQKALVVGISGEIRMRIVRYRSKRETADDCFPRLESVRDSLGNIWTTESSRGLFHTKMNLRTGDSIDFVVTATDPDGGPLLYKVIEGDDEWQESNELTVTLTDENIGRSVWITVAIKSNKPYHATIMMTRYLSVTRYCRLGTLPTLCRLTQCNNPKKVPGTDDNPASRFDQFRRSRSMSVSITPCWAID